MSFDENGDRKNAFYAFGNVISDGSINFFGYCYLNENGSVQVKVDTSIIEWPRNFTLRGIRPQSTKIITNKTRTISEVTLITMFVFIGLATMVVLGYIVLIILYRSNKIIKAASWKLNIVCCFGAVLLYIGAFLYGFDENTISEQTTLTIICNIRVWLILIGFTIFFMPLFLKTFRISRIFEGKFQEVSISDEKLLFYVVVCVCVDLVLLIIFSAVIPFERKYISINGAKGSVEIDALQITEYKYGVCICNSNIIFDLIVGLWKLLQL